MEQYLVAWDGVMTFEDDESVEAVLDRVMENLLASNLVDPTIEFNESTGRITFETIATGSDVLAAVAEAASTYRSALHAAGVGTQRWVDTTTVVDRTKEAPAVVFDATSVKYLVDA